MALVYNAIYSMNDLKEIDWVCASDYLNDTHVVNLYYLTSSSNACSWAIWKRILRVPWVLTLRYIDFDAKLLVADMVSNGMVIVTHLYNYFT